MKPDSVDKIVKLPLTGVEGVSHTIAPAWGENEDLIKIIITNLVSPGMMPLYVVMLLVPMLFLA